MRAAQPWSVSWVCLRIAPGQIAVLVPAGVIELDEADAAFCQTAGEQAVRGEGAGLFRIRAVEVLDGLGFSADVGDLRDAGLHPVGHFVLCDAGLDFRVELVLEVDLVEAGKLVEQRAATGLADAVGIG